MNTPTTKHTHWVSQESRQAYSYLAPALAGNKEAKEKFFEIMLPFIEREARKFSLTRGRSYPGELDEQNCISAAGFIVTELFPKIPAALTVEQVEAFIRTSIRRHLNSLLRSSRHRNHTPISSLATEDDSREEDFLPPDALQPSDNGQSFENKYNAVISIISGRDMCAEEKKALLLKLKNPELNHAVLAKKLNIGKSGFNQRLSAARLKLKEHPNSADQIRDILENDTNQEPSNRSDAWQELNPLRADRKSRSNSDSPER